MKAIVSVVIAFLVGCGPQLVNIKKGTPQVGVERTAYEGDVFFAYVDCYGEDNGFGTVFKGDCTKYDLTLLGVSWESITLQYREYMKPAAGQYGGYRLDGRWLVKEGFTKNLEYSTEDGRIRYKSHSFKILDVTGNSIYYVAE